MSLRIAVVDDDAITLTGSTAILDACPDVKVIASVTHDAALDPRFRWDDVDVALVDASDRRREHDHFPGVAVVERIRDARTPRQTRVVVVTGVMFDDAIRRRMREAGADFYYHRSELLDAGDLARAVLHPDVTTPFPEPEDQDLLFRLGVGPATLVNKGVSAAREEGLLSGEQPVGARGRERTRRRERFAQRARLQAVSADGRPPERDQRAPSLPQIDRFLHWATRLRDPDGG